LTTLPHMIGYCSMYSFSTGRNNCVNNVCLFNVFNIIFIIKNEFFNIYYFCHQHYLHLCCKCVREKSFCIFLCDKSPPKSRWLFLDQGPVSPTISQKFIYNFITLSSPTHQIITLCHKGLTYHFFKFLTFRHSGTQPWAPECPNVRNENGRSGLYGTEHFKCNCMMTLGFKGLSNHSNRQSVRQNSTSKDITSCSTETTTKHGIYTQQVCISKTCR